MRWLSELQCSGKSNSELVTPINIILNYIKELFMLVIALCTTCFFRTKINKNFGFPYFRISSLSLNALAPALTGKYDKICFSAFFLRF